MIIATAGHVDHGKTTLIKALTGVETDRLAEEKRRGMTIDLGFAYLPIHASAQAEAEPLGFIDVPGHQDFMRNMLCGIAGADFALLVIAADDGPKPQTVEHLAILDLLEIGTGAVVITKVDRVSAERLATARSEVQDLLAGTSLATAPVFEVSAASGAGIGALKDALEAAATAFRPRAVHGNFRLALDRRFSLPGTGLVVTGTVWSGSIAVGEQVKVLGSGAAARVRSIRAQNQPAASARAGHRCAVNLVGLGRDGESMQRGEWIVAGDAPPVQSKIDARLRVLRSEARPLRDSTPVHVHLAAAHATGRIVPLEGKAIQPGESGPVQLVLDRPIGASHGDRFIVRDQSARRTIGGGRVIDIFPPARGRARPERLADLRACESQDATVALSALLGRAEWGLPLAPFVANRNLTQDEAAELTARVPMVKLASAAGTIGVSLARWSQLRASVLDNLAAWHERSPSMFGPPADSILKGMPHRLPRERVLAVAAELARQGAVVKSGLGVRLPSHHPALDRADEALWEAIEPLLRQGGTRPPSVSQISYALEGSATKIEETLQRAAHCGLAIKVSQRHYFLPDSVLALAEMAQAVAAQSPDGAVTAAAFRDTSGIGRGLSIDVLEFFDRTRFTRRVSDRHVVNCSAADVFSPRDSH